MPSLEELIANARNTRMTEAQREEQRESFAYGNTNFENNQITRETVRRASQLLRGQVDGPSQHVG